MKKYMKDINIEYRRNQSGSVENRFLIKNKNVLIIIHANKLSQRNLNNEIMLSDSKENI